MAAVYTNTYTIVFIIYYYFYIHLNKEGKKKKIRCSFERIHGTLVSREISLISITNNNNFVLLRN